MIDWNKLAGGSISISKEATLSETMRTIEMLSLEGANQPVVVKLAKKFVNGKKVSLQRMFDWVYDAIIYYPDRPKQQDLRRATRTLSDCIGNCTDYSILISSMLRVLGVKHVFRVVELKSGAGYGHIYVVTANGVVMDPVLGQLQDGTENRANRSVSKGLGKEVNYFRRRDYKTAMPVELSVLAGTNVPTEHVVNGLFRKKEVSQGLRNCKATFAGDKAKERACSNKVKATKGSYQPNPNDFGNATTPKQQRLEARNDRKVERIETRQGTSSNTITANDASILSPSFNNVGNNRFGATTTDRAIMVIGGGLLLAGAIYAVKKLA